MAARSAAKNLLCYFKCMNRNGRAQRGEIFCYVISNKKKLGVLCCHHCGMEITDNKILLDYSDLTLKYNTVKPSCGGRCGEAICIRPKKQKQTLSQRVAKRNLDKDVMRQAVRKKRRRRPPVTSAGIPFLHGHATSKEFEGWLAANLAWWRKLA